jgi:nitrogen fixation protein NifX
MLLMTLEVGMESPHLRIAITTDSLIRLDSNFASTKQVVFYDVTRDGSAFVDVVNFTKGAKKGVGGGQGGADGKCIMDDMGDDDGTGRDPLEERVDALTGCSVLFTMGLSDLAAVRVHGRRIFPVKSEVPRDIEEVIGNVQRLMSGVPPLWMRRVMRDASGNRLPLDDQEI